MVIWHHTDTRTFKRNAVQYAWLVTAKLADLVQNDTEQKVKYIVSLPRIDVIGLFRDEVFFLPVKLLLQPHERYYVEKKPSYNF